MYSYYTLKALRYKLPKNVAMMITTLQIVQMMMGCTVTIAAYYYQRSGHFECYCTQKNFILAFLMYFGYMILFVRFFCKNYLSAEHASKDGKKIQFDETAKYGKKKTN
ncbi:putative fatty acid elongation protein 3 [Frieseomelitta varia]|uniref:putative fatty acid elongation protein 3 n=1 Tax=Frieseomelitta varia TaxID=561572 RepID=UPI001CB6A0B4|nr:putative fatty acid elongation protein 3 [Frieseomelitta varia]